MNPPTLYPSAPSSSSSFTFMPSPPNPNPYFSHSHLNNQNRPSSTAPPSPDLPTALSALKDLIRLSETAAQSISALFRTTTGDAASASASDSAFYPCPFNFHHRLPPESLFHHSLQCPSSPARVRNLDGLLLESLRYRNTLQSSHELVKQNRFVQTLHDPNADLCFSLDEYCEFGPNFFFRDCPGVVSSTDQDGTSRTFTLPGILSGECANFTGSGIDEIKGFSREALRLLPSELWLVRCEVEAWSDYPSTYSYSVLRALLCSLVADGSDFLRWVIVNSPQYGVAIDLPMRDHIVLLFQLCLKAIVTEATGSAVLVLNSDARELNPISMSLKCPILVKVLKWLSFQFSVLYGEMNGKLLAINMLKQWILNTSLNSSLFPLAQKLSESPSPCSRDVNDEAAEPFEKNVKDEKNGVLGECINGRLIFVSQVAAAVAALHERFLLEEKIKALRETQPLTNYQRMAEHAYFSKRADEERQKRSNYRPLLEHDGLFWQRSRNQETNKTKTREELLAEERDYKRRRMSYRGKKLKRSKTQVMRDIIEEYMEEITRAGGIGCLVKGAEEAGKLTSEPSLSHDISTDVDGLKKNVYNLSEISREWPHGYKKQLSSHNYVKSTRFEHDSPEYHKRHRRDSSQHREHLEARRSVDRDRRDREYYSKSPDRQRSNGFSPGHHSNHGHQDSLIRSHERTNHRRDQGDRSSRMKDRERRNAYRDYRSDSVKLHEFEDRYDPSQSCNMYEDDQYA